MKRQGRYLLFLAVLLVPSVASGEFFDHDGDGDVDLEDLQDFAACLGGPEVEASGPCAGTHDGDGDLDVDLFDFSLFQEAFTGPSSPIMATQLAGNSLDEYPFFEYVKAFNEDATVELGIDPNRFPEIVGQSGDIYVVEAKFAGAWEADPTLVDATPGGAQTETFGGTTIQENTFTVVGPYGLDSAVFVPATNDYTGLGHGYDIVIDTNQNGELDGGDYIDGFGREAGLYVVHDTTQHPAIRTKSCTTPPTSLRWSRCH
jgi:hypothetical protein